jgi:hypothetical protein
VLCVCWSTSDVDFVFSGSDDQAIARHVRVVWSARVLRNDLHFCVVHHPPPPNIDVERLVRIGATTQTTATTVITRQQQKQFEETKQQKQRQTQTQKQCKQFGFGRMNNRHNSASFFAASLENRDAVGSEHAELSVAFAGLAEKATQKDAIDWRRKRTRTNELPSHRRATVRRRRLIRHRRCQ